VRQVFRSRLGTPAFGYLAPVAANVVNSPVPERLRRRVGIFHDKHVTLRARRRIAPLEEGREIIAAAGMAIRDGRRP
jgi:hypothetical protein